MSTPSIHDPSWEPGDEPLCNFSANPSFADILERRYGRREVLVGGIAAALSAWFRPSLGFAAEQGLESGRAALLGFAAVPPSTSDTVTVPPGYRIQVLLPCAEPLPGAGEEADGSRRVGSHHDGMHFFPIDGSSEDGLLVINHEYVESRFLHGEAAVGQALGVEDLPGGTRRRDPEQVLREILAHGVTVVRIQQGADGQWQAVEDPRNRRITGRTPMEIGGPARGHALLRTLHSPAGTDTRGTLNNCAHGVTPWNTYLAAEENWAAYFRVAGEGALPRELGRYGVPRKVSLYAWENTEGGADEFARFDATPVAGSAEEDYRNEPNGFGWMVEIDPFDPTAVPVKRTALGRFAHEGVVFAPALEGKPLVCYSGDDARFEYIYKYVSKNPYHAAGADGGLLDEGTLHVARFNDDGTGEWLPLVWGQHGLTAENGFGSQAEVLVNTRAAADFVGATKMDRPEWGAVDPRSGEVYFTLTNNTLRTDGNTDAANPRPANLHGHIIRWREKDGNHAATRFAWELFLLAGDGHSSRGPDGQPLGEDAWVSCPDGLTFDPDGRLWIQTDIGETVMNQGDHKQFGNNQMLAADPATGDIRRFLTGPAGQEITGLALTPDQKTMFVNVQHPGANTTAQDFAIGRLTSRWPGNTGTPLSATVAVTRKDGGIIGA